MAAKKKISNEEKETIIAEHKSGTSMYRIAKNHAISATMVQYIINPEKIAQMREKAAKRDTEKAMNLARVHKWREKKKQAKE